MVTGKAAHFYGCQLATTDSVKQHKLRKRIAWLSDKEGRGREFISLYIPWKASIEDIVATLKKECDSEIARPENIKDRLQHARKEVIQNLKAMKEIPENGLAVFAGTFVADDPKREILNVEKLVPPEPITEYVYEVDDHFRLEPLREMLRDQRIIGVIAMDSKEASFGIQVGGNLELVENITSGVSGKTAKGGQSQRRYERERNMELSYFFHRVGEHATKAFLENQGVMALVVGGPGPTKTDFLKGNYLHYELKNALLSVVDTQSTGKEGVREVLSKSSGALNNICGPEEKKVMERLLAELSTQNGLATCGLDSVLDALKKGQAEVALMTDSTNMIEVVSMCRRCGHSKAQIVYDKNRVQTIQKMRSIPCEKCNAVDYEVEERDIVDVLEDVASQTDARVEVIASASEEKTKLTTLGGFAALLRYRSG